MDLHAQIQQIIPSDLMLPACGQGAIGIECRLADSQTLSYVAALNDPLTSICITTERQVNAKLGGNCHVPVAVFCQPLHANHLDLQAKVLSADGQILLTAQSSGPDEEASKLAEDCALQLFAQGAQNLLSRYV